jgi:PAS domain S-box-containing protein
MGSDAIRWRFSFDLPKRFETFIPPVVIEVLVAAVLVSLAVGSRLLIDLAFGDVVEFTLVFPAVVGATLLAGWRAGAMVVCVGQLLAWYFLLPIKRSFQFATPGDAVSLILTTGAEVLMLWFVAGYQSAMRRLVDVEGGRVLALQQRVEALDAQAQVDAKLRRHEDDLRQTRQNLVAIYDASADGLTLCRAIKNAAGVVVDYQVLEVNKAHQELTGATRAQMLGSVVSQIAPPVRPQWFSSADRAIKTGQMQEFDVRSTATGRWLNIRVSRVSDELFQQTFVDINDRYALEEQRQHLLKEMNHRITNNLQMVASFLHLQAGSAPPGAKDQLQAAEGRVQVLANLHSLLAYTESDSDIDAGAYISQLCAQLEAMIDRPDDIKLDGACEPLQLPADKIVPIGFIICELVTNAAKYAFPEGAKGTIKVRLTPAGDGWALSISDDGRGLDAKAITVSPSPKRGGLGTRLVQTFVGQIGGTLVTTSESGVQHVVTFEAEGAQGASGA